ncbi:MAG: hypothetical protein ACXVCY_01855 [Pseudobdellovibrionaceae bacterium]
MKVLGLVLFLFLASCAHSIHEVHTSDFSPGVPIESGRVVSGTAEQFVILGIVENTAYVDEAYQNLMNSCPNGSITAVTTQYFTSLGFFSWTNKILMQGLCVPKS